VRLVSWRWTAKEMVHEDIVLDQPSSTVKRADELSLGRFCRLFEGNRRGFGFMKDM